MVANLRGAAAVVGVGQLPWFKRGTSPDTELKMAVKAVLAAAEDANMDPRDIDGFVSWGSEQNAGQNMMSALGTKELRYGALVWTHGGGSAGSLNLAAQAIATGQAEAVVVIRAMAEKGGASRLSKAVYQGVEPPHERVNGMAIPAHTFAMRASRMFEREGLPRQAVQNYVQACYYHASRNPSAFSYGTSFDETIYNASACPVEPLHLYDNSRENDGAIALLLVSAERAKNFHDKPAYLLSAPMGRYGGDNAKDMVDPDGKPTAGFRSVAKRCWAESGYQPSDVDVAQFYTNASTAGINAMIDHGFCDWSNVGEFLRLDNIIAPNGGLPINTAGGDLADGFIHGAGNNAEAVRQIRGTSSNQVIGANLSLASGGPYCHFVSTALFGSEETL